MLDHLDELPELVNVVQIDGTVAHERVISWAELAERGREHLAAHPTRSTTPSPRSARSTWPP